MPISQESLLLIPMPYSVITVPQMHIPATTHFQKAVGGVKKFFCGHSSRMKMILNLTLFQKVQLTCKHFLQAVSIYWEASIFISNYGVLTLFYFLKTMCVLGHQESDFPGGSDFRLYDGSDLKTYLLMRW